MFGTPTLCASEDLTELREYCLELNANKEKGEGEAFVCMLPPGVLHMGLVPFQTLHALIVDRDS